jgi:hypothetical protein
MERAALMRPEKIESGDVWALTINDHTIVREVRSVAPDGMVSYFSNGKLFQCRLLTFRLWARSAELTSREDWFESSLSPRTARGAAK